MAEWKKIVVSGSNVSQLVNDVGYIGTGSTTSLPATTVLLKGSDSNPITGSTLRFTSVGSTGTFFGSTTYQFADTSGNSLLTVRQAAETTTLIGGDAGYTTNPGSMVQSVIIGENAVETSLNTGIPFGQSVAIGFSAGKGIFSGSGDTVFIGPHAGENLRRADKGVIIGDYAGTWSSQSLDAVYIGANAGAYTKPATAGGVVEAAINIGDHAGEYARLLDHSVVIGDHAGSGSYNIESSVIIGKEAGDAANTLWETVAIGKEAGKSAANTQAAIMIGDSSGQSSSGADYGIFLGDHAGHQTTGSNRSVMIGEYAGQNTSGTDYSIFLGTRTGQRIGTGASPGSNNLIIGNNITVPGESTGRMNIGGVLFGSGLNKANDFGNPRLLTETGAGRIGINRVNPSASLHVVGTTILEGGITLSGSINSDVTINGDLYVNGDVTTINTTELIVEDRLILLGSGSAGVTEGDSGIMIERQAMDGGKKLASALYRDSTSERWSVAGEITPIETTDSTGTPVEILAIEPEAFLSTVITDSGNDISIFQKPGNMKVISGEIYIYV